jgi:hypothetical protein
MGAVVKGLLAVGLAVAAGVAVAGSYAALGGGSYEPTAVADPCTVREWRNPDDLETVLEQVVLSALDGAACTLGVAREDLVLALRSEDALDDFAAEHGVSRADTEAAIRDGLERAVDEAEAADALPESVASIARRAIEALEPWRLIDALEALRFLLPG